MWSAAILAGGRARRLGGRDKGGLVVEGRRILDRQVDVLRPLVGEILLVGRDPSAAVPAGVRAIGDRLAGRGPLGGLHAALSAAAGDPTLIVACDMPFLSTAFLRHLLRAAAGFDAAVPETDRGYHPVCAAYGRTCLPAVERRLAAGRLTLIDLLDDLRVRIVRPDAFGDGHRLLANLNTPADCRAFETSHAQRPSS